MSHIMRILDQSYETLLDQYDVGFDIPESEVFVTEISEFPSQEQRRS